MGVTSLRLLVVVLVVVSVTSMEDLTMPDYQDHPCRRECMNDTEPMTCVYNFTVEWYHTMSKACYYCPFNQTDCFRPHCVTGDGFYKAVVTVNRRLPGPSIQVCHNDMIIVHVLNKMHSAEGTTIHWHGIHQKDGYQYMDGVPMLTQCHINPHTQFYYKFLATPAGTHLWHSHSGLQNGDGMYGALIIREPPATEPQYSNHLYDQDLPDHVVVIQDWSHMLAIEKFTAYVHSGGDNMAEGVIINGRGAKVPIMDATTKATSYTPYAKFTVVSGQRYRFRLISNAVLGCPFQVSVDNHPLLVIASDGSALEPYPTKNLVVYSGERYDIVLSANQTSGNYWLRVAGLLKCGPSSLSASQAAIIHYQSAPDQLPTQPTAYSDMIVAGKVVNPLNTPASADQIQLNQLSALPSLGDDPALRGKPDYKLYLGMDFNKIDNKEFNDPVLYPLSAVRKGMDFATPQINNVTNMMTSSPILSQPNDWDMDSVCNIDNTRNCPGGYCACVHRIKIRLNSVVEMIIVDEGVTFNASHPMHLHGYSFRVLSMAKIDISLNIEVVRAMDAAGVIVRNLDNPPKKDTVIVPDGGYTVVRFYADNPGEWLFHCHMLHHHELGLSLVLSVGETSDLGPVPPNFPKCGNFGSTNIASVPLTKIPKTFWRAGFNVPDVAGGP